ncbi:MAG: FAD binding domain-containing protein [Egibacteraceae bacterium]
MYAAEFEYLSPTSRETVVSLLDRHGDDAKVLAGGQSLIPMMNLRLVQPRLVIDINRLPLDDIRVENGSLVIPSGIRHRQLARDPLVARHAPLVVEAARFIGNVRVRSLGTIGGSVAHADPAAELPCVVTALDARIGVVGKDGPRTIPADEFFLTYLTTALGPTELVTEIRIPALRPRTGQAFVEFTRRASDFAIVEAAAVVELDRRERCRRVSLVFGGIQDSPLQSGGEASAVLVGEQPSRAALSEVARRVRAQAQPHDDVHGTAAYRLQLVSTLTPRVLQTAVERARGGRG